MSIEGEVVAVDAAHLVARRSASVRVRMSLLLVAIISRSIGSPMRLATQPASTSPKLPVGTAKETWRRGAPSATAAVK